MFDMKKSIYKISAFIFLIALAFQSCKVGPDYKRTELQKPESFIYDSIKKDTIINLRWWELFQDETLKTLIRVGLRENLDVLTAIARIEEAKAYHGFTNADKYPKFGYNADATSRNDLSGFAGQETRNYGATANVSWEIDFWGKYRKASESAKAEMLASEASKQSIMISLISDIAENYFQMLDFQKRLDVSIETYEARKKSVILMQAKFDHGYIPEIDLNQAQIQLAIAEASIPNFERALIATKNKLSLLLGKNPLNILQGIKLEDQVTPPNIPVGLPSYLIERRPDIIQSEFNVISANAQIGVAVAQRFPAISLTGSGGLGSSDVSNLLTNPLTWNIGTALTGSLFEFGKNKRRVEVQRYRTEQAVYAYKKTVLDAFRCVEDALVGIRTLKLEYEARSKQVIAADNALYLSEQRYYKGVTSYLEVLEQQRTQFESQLSVAQAHQEYLSAYVKLYKELGGGWISPEEEKEESVAN